MTINANYNDNVEITKEDGTTEVVAYLNGTLKEDKTFTTTARIADYDQFVANKDLITARINKFTAAVIDNVVTNLGNPTAAVVTESEVE